MRLTCFGLEFDNSSDGSEYFFTNDLHLGFAIRDDRWLDEVTLRPVAVAADNDVASLAFGRINIRRNALHQKTRRHG